MSYRVLYQKGDEIHTWDYSDHTMIWGGSYSQMGLLHYGVTVLHLDGVTTPETPEFSTKTG
jgi:hypothetical protein